jgi:predicted DNA-binding protein
MKSIKEKSIEIYPAIEGDLSSTSENLVKRKGFQTGANYVLDIIEHSLQEFSNYEDSLIIRRIIEQLKK